MAILISAHELKKSFTARPLFEDLKFSISSGERIGLIGPNGAGKSTLLRILAGQTSPDEGKLSVQRGLRVGFLEQVPVFSPDATVYSSIMEGSKDEYDWQEMARAQTVMARLSLSGGSQINDDTLISKLSGGWKKRVALGRELLKEPDLLLLDEPTNHLDVESILWLEEFVADASFATLTITHDRLFLQRIASRIIELDKRHPGGLLSVPGDYATFVETRESLMAAQEQLEVKLKNTLRRETEWLRRGAKARQTKQTARINNAAELKKNVEELTFRNKSSSVQIDFQSLEKNPKRLIDAKGISKKYGSELIVPVMDLLITPKSRIGLLGTNGCGKSTLIRLLTGTEKPDTGTVSHAERLSVAYFEQNRESLDQELTVANTVSPSEEWVEFQGKKVHIKSYLAKFLFSYEQLGLAVKKLSGGEQARLLIAKLMLTKANVLILDEPTNDLDMATLDILEDVLKEFNGAVIIVTHDRYFLDQVANRIYAFGVNSKGVKEIEIFEGLEQWEAWQLTQPTSKTINSAAGNSADESSAETSAAAKPKKKKLTYKDQLELDGMEENIKLTEAKLKGFESDLEKRENLANAKKLAEITTEISSLQNKIEKLYARWAELEKN